jgi:transcription antitermination factor NusG
MINQQSMPFRDGDQVRILAGPFSGLRGNIQSISSDQRTLTVILQFFGHSQSVEMFLMDVEKIG